MINTDKLILKWYNNGWKHECNGIIFKIPKNKLLNIAYESGRVDFIIGDEINSVDGKTAAEIINRVKKLSV